MNNYYHVKHHGGGPVEKQSNRTGSYRHTQPVQPNHQAANRPTYENVNTTYQVPVSQGPPPSFLTNTPLGTPNDETGALRSMRHNSISSQPSVRSNNHTSLEETYIHRASGSAMIEQHVEPPRMMPNVTKRARKNGFVHRWVYEEVRLSMSKMSIMSMVLGLLFLGALFFIIGFLAAVATLKTEEHQHDSHSAWQASNTPAQEDHRHGAGASGRLGHIATTVAGTAVGGAVHKQLQPLQKALGATAHIVPAPLQPFARYGMGSARAQVRYAGREVNPFVHKGPQAYAQPHYPNAPQQGMNMQQPYPQQYPTQTNYPMQGGFQQSGGMPQGGQAGYPAGAYGQGQPLQQPIMMQQPAQQPMMQQQMQQPMQQPYYQPTMQQQQFQQAPAVQQPMMSPPQQQMYPQQPMMQAPAYPQQMMPQQGYYR